MKRLLQSLLLINIVGLSYGFYIKSENIVQGELIIGLSLVLGFFIIMPLFIYHRWKNKNVKDYMLSKENIEKMREYNDSKDNKS
mgnify:CR=1 FL=1